MALPPYFWLVVLVLVALGVGIWWARMQQLDAQRRSMRAFYNLNEQIFGAPSPAEIAERLAETLPSIFQATTVRLYLWDRRTASLESVPTAADPAPVAFPLEGSVEGLAAGAVKCFQTRTPINIPDVRRNPLVNAGWKSGMSRSAIFVPLLAQQDVLGVIEVGSTRRLGFFTPEEQATLHHLANQVAASLKLEEQQAVREQLFRSEKLAATGQLISGVASDLRAPLERIQELASSLIGADGSSQIERGLKELTAEAQRAAEIVSRLVSFARPAETGARLVDVNALGSGLLQFREPEWKVLGLRVQNHLSPEPALVLGVQGQIEEVFLNLLVAAEQGAARSAAKTLEVSSSLLAGRVVVEIHCPDDAGETAGAEANLEVCRAIVQNHGGELRARTENGGMSFDVDLPLAPGADSRPVRSAPAAVRRVLTLMLVDVDLGAQRQLLGLLAAHGHRVVPARPEEAGDLAHRLRFDGVVWAVRPGSAKWSDFQERLRELIPTFVLVSDGYDADLAASLQENGGYLLGRPLEEPELERVLAAVEARTASRN
ncbi:MAG TPA: GAF domain-containing protein [Bryobacteraceae bacterium]|nr:GAF domain-containing protein [Bryobacteraceae bacterium]